MKFLAWLLSLCLSGKVLANPACTTLCPLIVGGGLASAQKMGVKDEVVGVLSGAL